MLLNHDNSDIAADAVEVLSELTDGDAVEDAVSAAGMVCWQGKKGGITEKR